jgi:hypothetical protein
MSLYSWLTDKVTLGKRIALLPQYKDDVRHYLRLMAPEHEWGSAFDELPATKMLKECLYNDCSPKKAAVIMFTTDFGKDTKHGPANPSGPYPMLYLTNMMMLKRALEGSGDDTPYS